MPLIQLPSWITKHLDKTEFQFSECDLITALHGLTTQQPSLKKYLLTPDGQIPSATAIFINGKLLQAPTAILKADDVIEIEPAIVGG